MQTNIHLVYVTVQGLRYLSKYNVVHMDMKPSNIIVFKGMVKLIDFGESYHPSICDKSTFYKII